MGLAASIANVNLAENVSATIGNNVTVSTADDTANVSVDALRDVDADVRVAAVAGGVVAAGVSYAGVNATGNALASVGSATSIGSNTARANNVTIRARNRSTQDALAYSMGAGYGGAAVGAVVNIDDTGSSTASIGNNASLYSSGVLTLSSQDTARNRSDALGVAVAAGVGLSVISSDIDVDRDAITTIGNGATIVADDVRLLSEIGDDNADMAFGNVTGASGGLLVGVNGSENFVDVDTNARVTVGDTATVSVNQIDSNNAIIDGTSLTVTALNKTRAKSDSDGFALGAAAIGAHVARVEQTGGTAVNFGAGSDLLVRGDATVTSRSEKATTSDLVAGAGGLLAAVGGESRAISNNVNQITWADASTANAGSIVNVSGDLSVLARNQDTYDSKIDASSIGLAGVTGGLAAADGDATAAVRIGNYASVTAHNVDVITNNTLAKTSAFIDNFDFSGGGGLSAAVGYAEATQDQHSKIYVGQNTQVSATGDFGNLGAINLKALASNNMTTNAKVSTGAVVSVPRALARNTAVSRTGIYFEDNSLVATERGDLNIRTSANADINSVAKTSVWGLAGVGAGSQAFADLDSTETIDFANGSVARANGFLNVYAGQDDWNSLINVRAKANVFNKTAVAINAGLNADAVVNRDTLINVGAGSNLQSARHMNLRAGKGTMNVSGVGRNQFTVLGVPAEDGFGSTTVTGEGAVNIDGRVETGIFNEQFIGFGRDFTNFAVASDGSTQRQTLTQLNGVWYVNGSPLNITEGGNIDDYLTSTRSGDNVAWTFLQNQNLANDIQDEIDQLNLAKVQASNPDAAANLSARMTDLQQREAAITGQSNSGTDIQAQIDAQTTIRDQAQLAQTHCNDPANTTYQGQACQTQSQYQTTIDNAQSEIDDWTDAQDDINDNAIVANDYDPSSALAVIQSERAALQAQINDIADSATSSNIDTEIAFLQAMLDSVNSDPVDVIQVGNLYAATGHVFVRADTLKGNSGTIHSENEVNITVRNDSPNPLQIQNIEIPNDPGGNIYFNDQLVSNATDVGHINLDKSANVGFNLSTTPNAFNPTVNIISRFDPNVQQWNPTVNGNTLDVAAPEITLAAGSNNTNAINNRGGSVNIMNRHGSIHQYGQINASEVSVTAGGALFVNDKTPGIHNIGAHPEANGGFGQIASTRLDNLGQGNDVGGCQGASGNLKLDPNNSESCTEGNLSIQDTLQNGDTGNRIVGGKIFLVANTVNLNGVIQSGIAEKAITIDANEPEFSQTSGSHTVNNEDIALRVTRLVSTNEAIAREGINGLTASYNADDDVIEVSGLEAKGGQITIAGKLISTGHGQINVLDGYSNYNVTNNSTKDDRPLVPSKPTTAWFGVDPNWLAFDLTRMTLPSRVYCVTSGSPFPLSLALSISVNLPSISPVLV